MSRFRSSTSVTHTGGTLYTRASTRLVSSSLFGWARRVFCGLNSLSSSARRRETFLCVLRLSRYLQKICVRALVAMTGAAVCAALQTRSAQGSALELLGRSAHSGFVIRRDLVGRAAQSCHPPAES